MLSRRNRNSKEIKRRQKLFPKLVGAIRLRRPLRRLLNISKILKYSRMPASGCLKVSCYTALLARARLWLPRQLLQKLKFPSFIQVVPNSLRFLSGLAQRGSEIFSSRPENSHHAWYLLMKSMLLVTQEATITSFKVVAIESSRLHWTSSWMKWMVSRKTIELLWLQRPTWRAHSTRLCWDQADLIARSRSHCHRRRIARKYSKYIYKISNIMSLSSNLSRLLNRQGI